VAFTCLKVKSAKCKANTVDLFTYCNTASATLFVICSLGLGVSSCYFGLGLVSSGLDLSLVSHSRCYAHMGISSKGAREGTPSNSQVIPYYK